MATHSSIASGPMSSPPNSLPSSSFFVCFFFLSFFFFFFFFFFLPHDAAVWELSSMTRDGNCAPCSERS